MNGLFSSGSQAPLPKLCARSGHLGYLRALVRAWLASTPQSTFVAHGVSDLGSPGGATTRRPLAIAPSIADVI